MAAALSLSYAVVTPPFQAADEPSHFFGFAAFARRPELIAEASAWAQLTHFERIQFNPSEKFRPSDIGRPGTPWNDGFAPETKVRGGGIRVLWSPFAPLVRTWPAPWVLLGMRAFNALLFGIGVGGFVWVVMRLTSRPSPHLLAWPLLLVPTLPFFGMHFSNHAPLLVAYVAVGLGILLLVVDIRKPAAAGLLIGAGLSAAIGLSRSALPLLPLLAPVLLARVLLGDPTGRIVPSVAFWLGIFLPLVGVVASTDPAFVDVQAGITRMRGWSGLTSVVVEITRRPWLLALLAPAAVALEVGVAALRRSAGAHPRLRKLAGWAITAAAGCSAAAVAAVMLTSLWIHYPRLRPLAPSDPADPASYVPEALEAALTSPRLRHHDHLTSVSFWGGFGWIDTLPSAWFIGVLTGLSGAALVILLLRTARRRPIREERLAVRGRGRRAARLRGLCLQHDLLHTGRPARPLSAGALHDGAVDLLESACRGESELHREDSGAWSSPPVRRRSPRSTPTVCA